MEERPFMGKCYLLFASEEARASALKTLDDYGVVIDCACGALRMPGEACPLCGAETPAEECAALTERGAVG